MSVGALRSRLPASISLATLAPVSDEVLVYPNRPRDPDELTASTLKTSAHVHA